MKEEQKDKFKLSMASYEFYVKRLNQAEQELASLTNSVIDEEDFSQKNIQMISDFADSYLTLSSKYKMEIENLHANAYWVLEDNKPIEGLTKNGNPVSVQETSDFVSMYQDYLEKNYNSQEIVEVKLKEKVRLLKEIGENNGYGEYE